MADDKPKNDNGIEEGAGGGPFESDSGLGNLPPLSDFESAADTSGTNLPPLDAGESGGDMQEDSGVPSALPPISDIPVETPIHAPKSGPPDFESPSAFDTPMSALDASLDSPQPETAFQDLAADSDFTPETPELGPGPDSMETPLFDSAFGTPETPHGVPGTGAPTRAMETPMFGGGDDLGFDEGAFTPGSDRGFASSTPAPDFGTESPETAGVAAPPPQFAAQPQMQAPMAAPPAKGGGMNTIAAVLLALVVGAIGVAAGYFLWPTLQPRIGLSTNPLQEQYNRWENEVPGLQQKASQLAEIQTQLDQIGGIKDPNELVAEIKRLTDEKAALDKQVSDVQLEAQSVQEQLAKVRQDLAVTERNLDEKLDAYAEADEDYEELLNQISIVRARDNGLRAEVERLEELVGRLEDSNARRVATKEALAHATERLSVTLKEGMVLVPPRFSVQRRTESLANLQEKLKSAQWVTPELLEEFTTLYTDELEIASTRAYFFARIPMEDRFGITHMKWAECVMNGNWSVFYRTLDGANIGTYENVAQSGPPVYEYRAMLPQDVQKSIENTIISARTPDYEAQVLALADRQAELEVKTHFQRVFDSIE